MRFAKVLGLTEDKKIKELVKKAEEKLSNAFLELSLSYGNKALAGSSGLGGDPLVFQLLYTQSHICDLTAVHLKELAKREEEQAEKVKKGEIISKEEEIPDELKKYRKQMSKRVLTTAATDGKRYYWNPEFILGLSKIGLRIVMQHEAFHSFFMQPARCGTRMHRLWNISIDYKVNFLIMEDLKARDFREQKKTFTENLGEYITLNEYASFLKDPFHPPPRLAHFNPMEHLKKQADPIGYGDPFSDRGPMYYADHELSAEMKKPENIYDYLLAQIPKCPECGRLGMYKKPQEYKDLEKKIKEDKEKQDTASKKDNQGDSQTSQKKSDKKSKKKDQNNRSQDEKSNDQDKSSSDGENHEHDKNGECCDHKEKGEQQPSNQQGEQGENGTPSNDPSDGTDEAQQPGSCCGNDDEDEKEGSSCCGNGCSTCGGDDSEYVDPFGAGDTLDDHIDADIGEDELAKRIQDAVEMSKRLAGKVPGGLEDELGRLTAPVMSWQDIIRMKLRKIREGCGRANWLKPKTKQMFAGLYAPKKRNFVCNFLAAYDCSGSMSNEDIAFGISQLQSLDEYAEGFLLPWDSGDPYYESMVKIKNAKPQELMNAKVKGRGGTNARRVFETYEKNCGKVDIIIMITDGYLYENELKDVKPEQGTDVIWLITSHNPGFNPGFGKIYHLRNEKL